MNDQTEKRVAQCLRLKYKLIYTTVGVRRGGVETVDPLFSEVGADWRLSENITGKPPDHSSSLVARRVSARRRKGFPRKNGV